MEDVKGTVTSLESLFPVEEAKKAVKRVEEAIAEKQKELDLFHHFNSENTNLLKLVQRLPDELFHDVMVPFGKAAFFPGHLIHTNEFLVLLGDAYYAERTSKQTVEILQRRGKVLESQINSLKAMMSDLEAEASFFDVTAAEAAEGLVEIRENYIEELPSESMSNQAEDEEYAKMMARLDELEREELAAGSVDDSDEDEDIGCSSSQPYFEQSLKSFEDNGPRGSQKQLETESSYDITAWEPPNGNHSQQNVSDESTLKNLKAKRERKVSFNIPEKPVPESNEKTHVASSSQIESSSSALKAAADSQKVSTNIAPRRSSDSFKAFTGSIVEHTHGIQTNSSQSNGSNPSKPVSRFKMQRGSR